MTLADMIERILENVSKDVRLRISSIEVSEIDDHLIRLMKNDSRIAKHFHIPLQSGSDEILRAMNRPYSCEEFLRKIDDIRKEIPEISISTDLIVGFPGESEALFEETCTFLKKCAFSFLHVFPFSLRSGTKAAQMVDQVSSQIKKERVKKCLSISQNLYQDFTKSWFNKTVRVLVEKNSENDSFGHSSNYLPIKINAKAPHGEFVDVIVKGMEGEILLAEMK